VSGDANDGRKDGGKVAAESWVLVAE
jgi:hypothetical protein